MTPASPAFHFLMSKHSALCARAGPHIVLLHVCRVCFQLIPRVRSGECAAALNGISVTELLVAGAAPAVHKMMSFI